MRARAATAGVLPIRKPTVSSSSGTGYVIAIVAMAMLVSAYSMYSVIIVLFGLLPGMVAMIIDQDPRRFISKIVLTFNGLGLAPFLIKIIRSKSGNSVAIEIIIDPRTWMMIFAAAAVGWVLYWVFPQVALMLHNMKINLRIKHLEMEMSKLCGEWGDDIKTGGGS